MLSPTELSPTERLTPLQTLKTWFSGQGWKPFGFQQEVWRAYQSGASGLIHATTGTGKTFAAWGGPLLVWLAEDRRKKASVTAPGLRILWITPLKALAADTEAALQRITIDLQIPWLIERRTGDTPASVRKRQKEKLPTALITTPESLSLLLARENSETLFSELEAVIVDEWHELLGSKRGIQTELCLARLRHWKPGLRIWGLSATLGNLEQAMSVLLGRDAAGQSRAGQMVEGVRKKSYSIESMLPTTIERFPWAGHLGIRLLDQVLPVLDAGRSSLVFTNTRAQTEIWYQAILAKRPQWAGQIALHHGSLDGDVRAWVEQGLRLGRLKCVVCTSSLDLGVDFAPVDQVLQIGSPKGVARLLQRAGRSGHQPGAVSKVVCVPTHALELIEFAATRDALLAGKLESREPVAEPLDVLVQHLVTVALGSGFEPDQLLREVRSTDSYCHLSDEVWEWVLDFIHRGGDALRAYPDYQRVDIVDGRYKVTKPAVARQHRMGIGTITSDSSMAVQYLKGSRLGTIEEAFIARLKAGDTFTFSGKHLEFIRAYNLTAYVRPAKGPLGPIPRWAGGRMPLSSQLSAAIREKLSHARRGEYIGVEMAAVRPILELQAAWSLIPDQSELLVEKLRSREGYHLFVYPFEGRLVHEGLASLFAYRLSRLQPITFTMAMNDYGFELLAAVEAPFEAAVSAGLFSVDNLLADITASLNAVEMAKRQFREVARISGLLFQGMPGAPKSNRHLQASAGLLFDVFAEYDPHNRLLDQARREVLEQQLEARRLLATLTRLGNAKLCIQTVERPTPLAFPLLVDRLREKLTSEQLADRVRRMQVPLEKAAGKR